MCSVQLRQSTFKCIGEVDMESNSCRIINNFKKNSIVFSLGEVAESSRFSTHFGGAPDVPLDFNWPQYTDDVINETYAINFLLQLNCEELKQYDMDNVLPEKGLLSFFYDVEGQPHEGCSDEKGCIRIFYFENTEDLVLAELPEDINENFCLPCYTLDIASEPSYPSWEDYAAICDKKSERKDYDLILDGLKTVEQENIAKLLGWADVLQCSMLADLKEETNFCLDEWGLLLQVNSIRHDKFELLFGDCGSIFLYINKKDLSEKKFDNIRLVLQC